MEPRRRNEIIAPVLATKAEDLTQAGNQSGDSVRKIAAAGVRAANVRANRASMAVEVVVECELIEPGLVSAALDTQNRLFRCRY